MNYIVKMIFETFCLFQLYFSFVLIVIVVSAVPVCVYVCSCALLMGLPYFGESDKGKDYVQHFPIHECATG